MTLLFIIYGNYDKQRVKTIQSFAQENAKSIDICIGIIMTHQELTLIPICHC